MWSFSRTGLSYASITYILPISISILLTTINNVLLVAQLTVSYLSVVFVPSICVLCISYWSFSTDLFDSFTLYFGLFLSLCLCVIWGQQSFLILTINNFDFRKKWLSRCLQTVRNIVPLNNTSMKHLFQLTNIFFLINQFSVLTQVLH